MSAAWVAGAVRARLLLGRRAGRERLLAVARAPSLRGGLALLAPTGYGRALHAGLDLERSQRAVAATVLLHLRVLAAWLPPEGASLLRALAAWFELANVEDRLAYLLGGELVTPFELGGLATAWPAAERAQTPAELRAVLARSAWGDPGGETPEAVHLGLRLSWGQRVLATVPEAEALVAGAAALLAARELFVAGRPPELVTPRALPGLGSAWQEARTFEELAPRLPKRARWALAGASSPRELWRAEVAWWAEAERTGRRLVRSVHEGREAVVGTALLLAADAWLTEAALAYAAYPGLAPPVEEVFGEAA